MTCCARLPFPSPFHCLPQNRTNLCTLTRAMWHKLGLSSVLRLYKFYFCHWTVVVKKSFLTLWVWFNLYTESWLLCFSQVYSFGLFLFSVMVQKMIEHLEYLVRYMCKTKIKFTNDWQGSLEAPVSGEVHHVVKQQLVWATEKIIIDLWVHTGLFKCPWSTLFWSALETNLCVNGSCFTWLVVLSCHRNLQTSKCWSSLSRKVKTFLETALIQSKRQNLMIKVSIIWSHNLTLSRGQAGNDAWEYLVISTKYW